MSRKSKFDWGTPYLLTDLKEGVFVNEPAVYVGKHDAEKHYPKMCAVCGEPLGSEGYDAFFLNGVDGYGIDIVIGKGCIRDRISARKIDVEYDRSTRTTLNRAVAKFPNSGRWYGTFLHHCIAKPYVRNKGVADRWDETVLKLPGVRYIMGVIDSLRDNGWSLDAEMKLECGRVDLLATHPEMGTAVFDWKSDQNFETKTEYFKQVNQYMAELHKAGWKNLSGYILWIRNEKREYVPFQDISDTVGEIPARTYTPAPIVRCTLNIDMDGGEGFERKRLTEDSHHRVYGEEVFFFVRPFKPIKRGYEFMNFEASPYREGETPQWFDANDVSDGLRLMFICGKKRHSFSLKANWKLIRPFKCTLDLCNGNPESFALYPHLTEESKVDENGNDYVEFEVSKINEILGKRVISHAVLDGYDTEDFQKEWDSKELHEEMKIRIPCIEGRSHFVLHITTVAKEQERKDQTPKPKPVPKPEKRETGSDAWEEFYRKCAMSQNAPIATEVDPVNEVSIPDPEDLEKLLCTVNPALHHFTPGHIYKSGVKSYGIYERRAPEKPRTCGMVLVAEVDRHGRKLSDLVWRHIYLTRGRKEYIHGISDTTWKVYTGKMVENLAPSREDAFKSL
jgi:hypothetical protein